MDLIINVWYFVSGFWTYYGPQTALGGHSGPLDQNHSFCNDRWFLIMRKLARDGSSNLEQSLTRLTRTSETNLFQRNWQTTFFLRSNFNDRTPLHFRYTPYPLFIIFIKFQRPHTLTLQVHLVSTSSRKGDEVNKGLYLTYIV